jgi:hypothetical protein
MTAFRLSVVLVAFPALGAGIDTPANPVTAVAFHPTTGQLAAGGYGEVLIRDAPNPATTLKAPDRRIAGLIGRGRGLAFSKDGIKLVVAAESERRVADYTDRRYRLGRCGRSQRRWITHRCRQRVGGRADLEWNRLVATLK